MPPEAVRRVQSRKGMRFLTIVLLVILAAPHAAAREDFVQEMPRPSQPEHSVSSEQRGEPQETVTATETHRERYERTPQGWTRDKVALLAHLGIGAPAGALGVDLDIAPIKAFALRLGAGISLGGPQLAALPRLRLAIGKGSFLTLGTGPSVGRYVNGNSLAGLGCLALCALGSLGEGPASQTFRRAVWYNVELGIDAFDRKGSGLFRASLGYGTILNDHDYSCEEKAYGYPPGGACNRTTGQGLFYATAELGFFL
jgi:hypothetical protein